jgi:hypothetical protein
MRALFGGPRRRLALAMAAIGVPHARGGGTFSPAHADRVAPLQSAPAARDLGGAPTLRATGMATLPGPRCFASFYPRARLFA